MKAMKGGSEAACTLYPALTEWMMGVKMTMTVGATQTGKDIQTSPASVTKHQLSVSRMWS